MTDPRDNHVYHTVIIGNQTWMAENLNYGTMTPSTSHNAAHVDMADDNTVEKHCANNRKENCRRYGALYTRYEAMQYRNKEPLRGVCPPGWHIPSDIEWKKMERVLGMTQQQTDAAGYRGADAGAVYTDSTRSGFIPQMSGVRNVRGGFTMQGNYFSAWTSTAVPGGKVWYRSILRNRSTILRDTCSAAFGKCVRCVKDPT